MDYSDDYSQLDAAMQHFIKTLKRPSYWSHISKLADVDLDRTSAILLQLLDRRDNCRVQDAANELGIEPPSVTRKTQELEQRGYIARVQSNTDKRSTTLQITESGREISQRIWCAKQTLISNALQDWPEDERHQFVQLFAKYADSIASSIDTNY